VNSLERTFYFHSVDASGKEKMVEFIAEGLENTMKKIGHEHVVQVHDSSIDHFLG